MLVLTCVHAHGLQVPTDFLIQHEVYTITRIMQAGTMLLGEPRCCWYLQKRRSTINVVVRTARSRLHV